MQVQPYLNFYGRCEEALEFYSQKLGAKTTFQMRFKEAPEVDKTPAEWQDKIMHVSFTIGDSALMASDGMCAPAAGHHGYSLSLDPKSSEEGKRLFDALADGGTVTMPYGPTFWADGFGMVTDRFGVHWMINVMKPQQS
ncbi:VOC family metalloprotein YjdN [Crenobacter sp. SG2303]|uniref:VOC family metalloprotein YjdN n=1 Tax=Crenobacter oryzisoli TaxID=3056844 RepID=A0ABT7XI78_9NEIS|nr:VOC family metalloprotein YjdN [Crenobacter sp. SG2303]MDN0073488.1 VOC family metalloprotein YjdN [Crenobacter sp. SG2303]